MSGLMTVVAGIAIPICMVDGPSSARYFTPAEKEYFCRRLDYYYKSGNDGKDGGFQWKYLRQALSDVKIYLNIFIMWGNSIPGYA